MRTDMKGLLLLLLLAGCDSYRDYPEPEGQLTLRTVEVTYLVEGTYASCDVTYEHVGKGPVSVSDTALPWRTSFSVTYEVRTTPIYIYVRATCAEPGKKGKSKTFVLLDGQVKDSGAAVGYGATSEAHFVILDE